MEKWIPWDKRDGLEEYIFVVTTTYPETEYFGVPCARHPDVDYVAVGKIPEDKIPAILSGLRSASEEVEPVKKRNLTFSQRRKILYQDRTYDIEELNRINNLYSSVHEEKLIIEELDWEDFEAERQALGAAPTATGERDTVPIFNRLSDAQKQAAKKPPEKTQAAPVEWAFRLQKASAKLGFFNGKSGKWKIWNNTFPVETDTLRVGRSKRNRRAEMSWASGILIVDQSGRLAFKGENRDWFYYADSIENPGDFWKRFVPDR